MSDALDDVLETRLIWDAEDGLTVVRAQDCQDVLDEVARLHNAGVGKTADGWLVGRLPLIVYEQFLNQGINLLRPEHRDVLMRVLNDPDYRRLRIVGGRV